MPRALGKVAAKRHRKRYLKQAKGFWGRAKNNYRTARQWVNRAEANATTDRRRKKRDFRRLWILRINAAARLRGLTYSMLVNGLSKANVEVNRKLLADAAANDPKLFDTYVEQAKAAANN